MFVLLGEVGEAPATSQDVPHLVQHVLGITAPLLQHIHALMVTMGRFGFMVSCTSSCLSHSSCIMFRG